MLNTLQIVACIVTIAVGLFALLRPKGVGLLTGLAPQAPPGVAHIRASMGGLLIGLGAAPLILGSDAAFATVGIANLAAAAVRLASIVIDRSAGLFSLVSLAGELAVGVILIL
jgi:hypothetical protein